MTRPSRYLLRMMLFLAVVTAGVVVMFPQLRAAFIANPALNGLIVGVFVLGVIYNFRQVFQINPEVDWIEHFRESERPAASQQTAPRLLASLAAMIGATSQIKLTAMAMRSVLDGIATRLDEQREISRYTIGLLVFLGLLGTFWGLLDTLGAIRGVITNIQVGGGGDISAVFEDLKTGLEKPLAGMGTAFSSSLFGLAGSLILGFLDLQTGQAQNRFFGELEDWLSSLTKLSGGTLNIEGGGEGVPAYVEALLEQTAESLENLQRTIARGEDHRQKSETAMMGLADKMGTMTDFMQTEQMIMKSLAETQRDLKPTLDRLAGGAGAASGGSMDEATRTHIRNMDLCLARLLEESRTGREELVSQLRSEIKLLARTVAATKDEG